MVEVSDKDEVKDSDENEVEDSNEDSDKDEVEHRMEDFPLWSGGFRLLRLKLPPPPHISPPTLTRFPHIFLTIALDCFYNRQCNFTDQNVISYQTNPYLPRCFISSTNVNSKDNDNVKVNCSVAVLG